MVQRIMPAVQWDWLALPATAGDHWSGIAVAGNRHTFDPVWL